MGSFDNIDHIVYVCPNLEEGKAYFHEKLGCKIYDGGRHITKGTHNALFRIGKRSYFEILSPDPDRNPDIEVNWLGTQNSDEPRISAWCIKPSDYEKSIALLNSKSKYEYISHPGSRKLKDGSILEWKLGLCDRTADVDAFPFLIDWGNSTHPSESMKQECDILNVMIEHPCPQKIHDIINHEGVMATITPSNKASINIEFDSPNGKIII